MFAGWYTSPEDAAAFDVTIRVNGSDRVACNDREITLHGSWKTPAENAAEKTWFDLAAPVVDKYGLLSTSFMIAADLEASAAVLGVKEVVAYPYGHYNDTTRQGVAQAGFEMGRTIDPGYVHIGTDKLALPVVRIDYGTGLDAVIGLIG